MAKNTRIVVRGVDDIKQGLKRLGYSAKQSRTQINKALRPAATKLVKGMQRAYRKEFNTHNKNRDGKRTPTWETIGIITAKRSREAGLFVGPIKKRTTPIRIKGGDSYNLAAMQIKGNKIQNPRRNIFEETARKMESTIYVSAERDLDKMLNKLIKKAGF
jgi:hypothetical protein